MKTAKDVILNHHIQSENSCIAWAIEFILKVCGKLELDEYPLQKSGEQFNFGEKTRTILRKNGVESRNEHLAFWDFHSASQEEAKKGFAPVFAVISAAHINLQAPKFQWFTSHSGVAIHLSETHQYYVRQHGMAETIQIPLEGLCKFLNEEVLENYKLDCLFYRC